MLVNPLSVIITLALSCVIAAASAAMFSVGRTVVTVRTGDGGEEQDGYGVDEQTKVLAVGVGLLFLIISVVLGYLNPTVLGPAYPERQRELSALLAALTAALTVRAVRKVRGFANDTDKDDEDLRIEKREKSSALLGFLSLSLITGITLVLSFTL